MAAKVSEDTPVATLDGANARTLQSALQTIKEATILAIDGGNQQEIIKAVERIEKKVKPIAPEGTTDGQIAAAINERMENPIAWQITKAEFDQLSNLVSRVNSSLLLALHGASCTYEPSSMAREINGERHEFDKNKIPDEKFNHLMNLGVAGRDLRLAVNDIEHKIEEQQGKKTR